jgi:hypothetical protein
MDNFSSKIHPPKTAIDIRAPHGLEWRRLFNWRWQRGLALLLSDGLGLGLAWKIGAHLNQFYSPIPPQLNWWNWLGLPSLFWVFAAFTLLLFANNGLYHSSTQWKNYVRCGKLISFVYLLSLVLSYFYDPKLDAPRSLHLV